MTFEVIQSHVISFSHGNFHLATSPNNSSKQRHPTNQPTAEHLYRAMSPPLYSLLVLLSWLCSSALGDTQLCRDVFPGKPRRSSTPAPCPSVLFRPGRHANSFIVVLSFSKSSCMQLGSNVQVAFHMVGDKGFPSGRQPISFALTDGDQRSEDFCPVDLIDLPLGPLVPKGQVTVTDVPCFFLPAKIAGQTRRQYLQPILTANLVPSMVHFYVPESVISADKAQIRFTWRYEVKLKSYKKPTPKVLFVLGEVYSVDWGTVFPFKSSKTAGMTFSRDVSPGQQWCYRNPTVSISSTAGPGNPADKYVKACRNSGQCSFNQLKTTTTTRKPRTTIITYPKQTITTSSILAPSTSTTRRTSAISPTRTTSATNKSVPFSLRPEEPAPLIVIEGAATPPTPIRRLQRFRFKPSDVYKGCKERTKGCIVPPKGSHPRECLKSRSCELVIAFQRQDVEDATKEVVVVEMYHTDPGEWFAIGLNFNSDSPQMGNTYVIECVDEGGSDGPVIYNSFNFQGKYANKRYPEDGPEGAGKIIQTKESWRRGREIYCRFHIRAKFERKVPKSGEVKKIDLHKRPVFLVAAWGKEHFAGPHGRLLKHQPRHQMRPRGKKAVLGARFAPSRHQRVLMEGHGLLMTWVTLFCLPLGTYVGRFFKETFPNVKLCRKVPLWLFVHVVLMTFAVILIVCGMAVEIQGHVGWKSLRQSKVHSYVGGSMGGLLLLNFFSGAFVQVSRHGKSNWSGVLHALIGHAVVLCGFVLLLQTDAVSFGNAPCHIKYIAGAVVFTYIVIHIAMSYHYCWVDFIVGLRKGRGFGVMPIGVLTEAEVTQLLSLRKSREYITRGNIGADGDVIAAPGAKVRVGGFILLSMLTFMYSAWASILIATNTNGPCVPLDQYEGDIS